MAAHLISQNSKVAFLAFVNFGTAVLASNVRICLQDARCKEKEASKSRKFQILRLLWLMLLPAALFLGQEQTSGPAQVRIQREVIDELLMLPYFGVFDNIEYQVNGDAVTLLGSVTRPTLKSDAESSVKLIG
jgi:hypothetical protein